MNQVFIGVCLTYDDYVKNKEVLLKSLNNLKKVFNEKCYIYIVIQSNCDISLFESGIDYLVIREMNVSNARNLCIEKSSKEGFKYLLFHDATIFWTVNAALFIKEKINQDVLLKVKLKFTDITYNNDKSKFTVDGTYKKINPMYNTYVGMYLFEVEKIKNIKFSTEHGPGSNTKYKSGEDVLFLYDYMNLNGDIIVYESNQHFIEHPKRDSDYSKHLYYAYGQGRVFRVLLKSKNNYHIYLDLMFFLGNACVRCFMFKKNSLNILKLRIKGLLNL
ncbi:hypothetical protein ACCE85_000559 [Photobacterium damselae]